MLLMLMNLVFDTFIRGFEENWRISDIYDSVS